MEQGWTLRFKVGGTGSWALALESGTNRLPLFGCPSNRPRSQARMLKTAKEIREDKSVSVGGGVLALVENFRERRL